ncbi:hypothetical protein BDQ94DRAFT_135368 [Aspergillus welwitschiae]|uniref:Uncharacterized protein n=1 Tax=Aspergillus welwitschiae TaxID=1341132 RepID=A0A3F3QFK7_9EURO|nr:hypothetical protein BDQ94DRAFT_135368 [Aspergillus welwitschiae]RDH37951.1 hypothetical protein BDQ94DRAFT_135368 [Aspergillus welwitschiae]
MYLDRSVTAVIKERSHPTGDPVVYLLLVIALLFWCSFLSSAPLATALDGTTRH